MEKKTRHREPCATIWCLQRGDRETARKRCPHTCVLQSLVMRMILCDSVEPSATCYTLLILNQQQIPGGVVVALLIVVKLMLSSASLILRSLKKKKKSTGLGNENYILVNPSTIIPLCCAGILGIPQSSCFYLLLLTLPYIMAAIPLSKQE